MCFEGNFQIQAVTVQYMIQTEYQKENFSQVFPLEHE